MRYSPKHAFRLRALAETRVSPGRTPDDWVPRHPSLVRLTGRHPFNVEPPLPDLMKAGFLTPASLHYVRNHGAVPKCEWSTHRLSVDGLVESPTSFSMDDLLAMPAREIPVTLVCAGNRRKEENLVKQTIGFNWGAAGVSTSVWKGVLVRDILLKCGVKTPKDGANHVCFVGAETMPKGRYGTSIDWFTAMDPSCDVMLAYEQNGERLTPDHGYPLRLVIPGYIGGRMIKWLTEISVTTKESDNHFHYMDNRVLPEFVDAERATAEGWWFKPDYIINQLNINSAIAYPGHQEYATLAGKGQTYKVSGYCYSGGGRKVIRVELSTDGGKTWTLTTLKHLEKPTQYGKYWCWCFWEHEIDLAELWQTEGAELLCRGWDASMNRQPEELTWNVMGMMNNSYFRVKVHRVVHPETGKPALQFQHPTLAGPGNFGGWFEEKVLGKQKDAAAAKPAEERPATFGTAAVPAKTNGVASAPTPTPAVAAAVAQPTGAQGGAKLFTMEEVERHGTKEDCWIVVKDRVYDATAFLEAHPGGASSILITAGTDCSDDFAALHSEKAWKQLEDYFIGFVAGTAAAAAAPPIGAPPAVAATATATSAAVLGSMPVAAEPAGPVALDPKKWMSFPLIEREDINHNTRRYRFGLPSASHELGLPVGQHIFLKAMVDGKPVMRAYTPLGHGPGYVDFVIKAYFPLPPRFPNGGVLTMHMEKMRLGDSLQFKGPLGEYVFNVRPRSGPVDDLPTFTKEGQSQTPYKALGLIAGGSGITPCLQVANALLAANTTCTIKLLYANQTPEDVLCQPELDRIAADPRVSVWYTVDRAPDGWRYDVGFISEQMLRAHLPPPGEHTCIFMCGPPPMLDRACKPNLAKLGHAESHVHCF